MEQTRQPLRWPTVRLLLVVLILHFVFDEPTRPRVVRYVFAQLSYAFIPLSHLFDRPAHTPQQSRSAHRTPPRPVPDWRQNFIQNNSFESWAERPYLVLNDWKVLSTVSPWDAVKRETAVVRTGTASASFALPAREDMLSQRIDEVDGLRGHAVTFSAWALSKDPQKPCLEIDDGVSRSSSCVHSGNGTWEHLTLTHTVNAEATQVEFRIRQGHASNPIYIDDAMAIADPASSEQ